MSELAIMGASSLMGFVFKLIANSQEDRARQHELLIQGSIQNNMNSNDASKRAGIWMQRFAVLILITLFAVISIGVTQPTNIVSDVEPYSFLFGIITIDRPPVITQVDGMLYTETLSISILSILSYLFGSQTATR